MSLDFAMPEYEARLAAVRGEMRSRRIDALIVDQFEHLVYLFGYLPTAAKYQACIVPVDGAPRMIVRSMDLPTFRTHSWLGSFREFADYEDPVRILAEELQRDFPKARIGFEGDSHIFTAGRYLQLKHHLPEADLVDFSPVLIQMRLIKSPAELNYMREAAGIADACMAAAIEAAAEGVNEREAAAAAYATAMRAGADNGRVLLSASGPLSDNLHGRLGTRILASGDLLHLEMVPQIRGYSARLMRPVFIGAPAPEVAAVGTRLIEIQERQFAAIRPGVPGREIDRIAREQLEAGLCERYRNHTGYTLGYHAQPRTSDLTRIFTPIADWELEPGMVFHMFLSIRGVSIGETILVTPSGAQRLTRTERRLFVR
ncbi:MAG: M24 family metallopeptidase [Parvibaculaceae bacterium]